MVLGATGRRARWAALAVVVWVALAGCGVVAHQQVRDPPGSSDTSAGTATRSTPDLG